MINTKIKTMCLCLVSVLFHSPFITSLYSSCTHSCIHPQTLIFIDSFIHQLFGQGAAKIRTGADRRIGNYWNVRMVPNPSIHLLTHRPTRPFINPLNHTSLPDIIIKSQNRMLESMLDHPVLSNLIRVKWAQIAKFYYFGLVVHTTFVAFLR